MVDGIRLAPYDIFWFHALVCWFFFRFLMIYLISFFLWSTYLCIRMCLFASKLLWLLFSDVRMIYFISFFFFFSFFYHRKLKIFVGFPLRKKKWQYVFSIWVMLKIRITFAFYKQWRCFETFISNSRIKISMNFMINDI